MIMVDIMFNYFLYLNSILQLALEVPENGHKII